MNIFNPDMLKLAREYRGLTQKELVEKTRVSNAGNYNKYEKGKLSPPISVLERLSNYLDFPIEFFYKESPSFRVREFYYRRRISIPVKELESLEAKFKLIAMSLDEILPCVEIPDFELPSIEITEDFSPVDAANKIRFFLNLQSGPIKNLINVIESAGIIVYFIQDATDKFSGLSLMTDSGRPVIFVNANMSNDRIRLTLAHELGHIVCHIRRALSAVPLEEIEREAYTFASEFLMPTIECRADLFNLQFRELDTLKSYWRISKAAIIFRAYKDGYLSPERYKTFMIELSRKGERKKESGNILLDSPVLMQKIIEVCFDELCYSVEELIDLLKIKKRDFEILFEVPPRKKVFHLYA